VRASHPSNPEDHPGPGPAARALRPPDHPGQRQPRASMPAVAAARQAIQPRPPAPSRLNPRPQAAPKSRYFSRLPARLRLIPLRFAVL